jgi:hypothetical protein
MIDPKLNELPVPEEDQSSATAREAASGKKPRTGLSINDTVAGNASLSTGARGVDTSGVSAGAGVGAGMTLTDTGASGESPAPQIVPGYRGSGTTVRGGSNAGPPAATMPGSDQAAKGGVVNQPASGEVQSSFSGHESTSGHDNEIAVYAYRCWLERGCPEGSSEVDWQRAEKELRARRSAAGA